MTKDIIGVDISKDHLDVHRMSDGASRRFTNDKNGHRAFLKWLGERTGECIVYEPTEGPPIHHRECQIFGSAVGNLKEGDPHDDNQA